MGEYTQRGDPADSAARSGHKNNIIYTSPTTKLFRIVGGMISYFRGLLGSREMRILILGLDGAGKTTILYRLQVGEVVTTIPTIGFNVEQVTYKNLKFQVWDLGGQTSIRPYWRCYYSNTDAIIYVVDSVDRDRIGISKDELLYMLRVKLICLPCSVSPF